MHFGVLALTSELCILLERGWGCSFSLEPQRMLIGIIVLMIRILFHSLWHSQERIGRNWSVTVELILELEWR